MSISPPPTGLAPGRFKISVAEKQDVDGFVHESGLFGIHQVVGGTPGGPCLVLTHVGSGKRICSVETLTVGVVLIKALLGLGEKHWRDAGNSLDRMPAHVRFAAQAIVQSISSLATDIWSASSPCNSRDLH